MKTSITHDFAANTCTIRDFVTKTNIIREFAPKSSTIREFVTKSNTFYKLAAKTSTSRQTVLIYTLQAVERASLCRNQVDRASLRRESMGHASLRGKRWNGLTRRWSGVRVVDLAKTAGGTCLWQIMRHMSRSFCEWVFFPRLKLFALLRPASAPLAAKIWTAYFGINTAD